MSYSSILSPIYMVMAPNRIRPSFKCVETKQWITIRALPRTNKGSGEYCFLTSSLESTSFFLYYFIVEVLLMMPPTRWCKQICILIKRYSGVFRKCALGFTCFVLVWIVYNKKKTKDLAQMVVEILWLYPRN